MKIQENLVFDKSSNELIGFIDLGDPLTTSANVDEDSDPIASHALAFLVRGLTTHLMHVVAYYFTGNVTSFQLMPLFWKVVAVLETTVKLKVIAAVNDGASPNRKFFNLHANLGGVLPDGVVYKTPNLFCPSRMIYFFAGVPHLMQETVCTILGLDRAVDSCGTMASICYSDILLICIIVIKSLLFTDCLN